MKNSPINHLQQLMCITMEECGELTQRCSKMMRKYKTLDQAEDEQLQKLTEEVGDVVCMISLLVEHDYVKWPDLEKRVEYKKEKLKKWSTLV
jgi:NTP pyrophosphatase (non-canonical NTP hydrolase)|tara:strand:+ start:515 stop:790 length:276 start_codon:yes stop_codon:yes gene_type:complete